jgi:hypothetical protein
MAVILNQLSSVCCGWFPLELLVTHEMGSPPNPEWNHVYKSGGFLFGEQIATQLLILTVVVLRILYKSSKNAT